MCSHATWLCVLCWVGLLSGLVGLFWPLAIWIAGHSAFGLLFGVWFDFGRIEVLPSTSGVGCCCGVDGVGPCDLWWLCFPSIWFFLGSWWLERLQSWCVRCDKVVSGTCRGVLSLGQSGANFGFLQWRAVGPVSEAGSGWTWTYPAASSRPCGRKRGGFCWLLWFLVWGGLCRIGEAAHPGPNTQDTTWTFGIANPSGLNSKVDLIAHQMGHTWVYSETQLTNHGFSQFRKGLKVLKSPWKYLVPGHPCPSRKNGQVGNHSGVLLASKFPARALPHNFDEGLFASGHLQVAGFVVDNVWVQVGMLYGVPCNNNHVHAKYQTETCLAELIDRIAGQTTGPRIICGDFNYAVDDLAQLRRLVACGFREVQDLRAWRHGISVQPTGRGSKRIDQIWISPELQACLRSVDVSWDHWADHAAVQVVFERQGLVVVNQVWRTPAVFPWPADWDCQVAYDTTLDPTIAYAQVWRDVEVHARCWNVHKGIFVSKAQCGRAQTLQTCAQRCVGAPPKSARHGEVAPGFYGLSMQHARFFKQLRRLQALKQLLAHGVQSQNAQVNAMETWRAIRAAAGFPGGFGLWWQQNGLSPGLEGLLPYFLPSLEFVRQLFEGFQVFLKKYEAQLAKQRYQFGKNRRQADMNLVFRDCKDGAPPVVDTLLDRVEAVVEEVRECDVSLVLTKPVVLMPDLPVVVNGGALQVIAHDSDQVWVSSVAGVSSGDLLTQERVVMSDQAILQRFREVWEPRWNKLSHVAPGQWDQICGFLERVLSPVPWNFTPWTSERFAEVIKQKKATSAKGPDGVSQPDLATLPAAGCAAMADLYRAVEAGGRWPDQVACGFVASLAKNGNAQTVDEYRPITVYSLLYRTWSSARAREALRIMADLVPSSVQGGLPARQAKHIWYTMAQQLEDAYVSEVPLHGLLMDVRRAFNAIPRFPLWTALVLLGFPSHILHAWVVFVAGQTRRFKVRASVGEPVSSNCGLPEGCALSVFGMVVVDWILDLWLHASMPSLGLHAFIDDWGVIFQDHAHFQRIWQSLLDFTGVLDLELDLRKTKLWSTDAAARKALRQQPLHLELAARNLGAHQNFSRHSWNAVLLARLKGMPEVFHRLRASLSPYHTKVKAVRAMAWPRALHGVSVVHVGGSHFKVLRTAVMRGIGAERKGANPLLHLASNHLEVDPEAWCIVQTFRDARELSHPDRLHHMLSLFAQQSSFLPANGPTAVLGTRIARLGWAVGTNGLVQDRFGSFSVVQVGWDELWLRTALSWGHVMGVEVEHRSSFQGIDQADILETQSALAHFGLSDQVYLRCHLDGTLYTQNGRAHFQEETDGRCPWCDQKDGFYHRAWECDFFSDCRTHMSAVQLAQVPSLPLCLTCHGWSVLLPEWDVFSGWLLADHGFSQMSPAGLSQLKLDQKVEMFVDGTAAHPTEPKLRYAAWAVTIARLGQLDNEFILGGHVQGLSQSPFRAELTAMVAGLRWAKQRGVAVRVWTDCLAVLKGVARIKRGGLVRRNRAHSDLWLQIADLLVDGEAFRVQVVKVVSHGQVSAATGPVEEWAYWHNGLTDRAATHINTTRPRDFWTAWDGLARALTQHRKLHRAILLVLLKSGRKAHLDDQKRQIVPVPIQRVAPAPSQPMPVVPARWTFPEQMVKRYGRVNVEKVHEWWSAKGALLLAGDAPLAMISGLQLFLDFFNTTQYEGPWVHKKRWFAQLDQVPPPARVPWGLRVKAFLLIWKTYMKHQQVRIPQKMTRPQSIAISHWVVCYRLKMPAAIIQGFDAMIIEQLGRQLASAADFHQVKPAMLR